MSEYVPSPTAVAAMRHDLDEILPHPLIADLRRWFVNAVAADDNRSVTDFLAAIEQAAIGAVRQLVDERALLPPSVRANCSERSRGVTITGTEWCRSCRRNARLTLPHGGRRDSADTRIASMSHRDLSYGRASVHCRG